MEWCYEGKRIANEMNVIDCSNALNQFWTFSAIEYIVAPSLGIIDQHYIAFGGCVSGWRFIVAATVTVKKHVNGG